MPQNLFHLWRYAMLDTKTIGWLQIIGAVLAWWLGGAGLASSTTIFAVLFLLMGIHHLTE